MDRSPASTLDPVRTWVAHVTCAVPSPVATAASAIASCSSPRASAGSTTTPRSGASTPTARCSSAACGRCCCSRCTRWRWPASPSTATTAPTRGTACSAPPTSSRPRRTARHPRPSGRSPGCMPCTSGVVGVAPDGRPYAANDPHLLAVGARRRGRQLPRRPSALRQRRRSTAGERDEYVREMAVIARALGVPAPPESERALRDQIRPSAPNCAAHRRTRGGALHVAAAADASWRSGRCTRCSARPRWRCCRGGHAGRCACRRSRSSRPSRCGRRAMHSSAACVGRCRHADRRSTDDVSGGPDGGGLASCRSEVAAAGHDDALEPEPSRHRRATPRAVRPPRARW